MKNTWSTQDRQAFRDGNRLRASSVPARRFNGPSPDEWGWADDDELEEIDQNVA